MNPAPAPPAAMAGGRRFTVRSDVEPFPTRAGDLLLLRYGESDLRVVGPDDLDHELMRELTRGDWTAAGLAARLGADAPTVTAKLEALARAGVLAVVQEPTALPEDDRCRFARQMPYLGELAGSSGAAAQVRLRSCHVAVLGCGGVGTWTLAALACSGIGRLTLVDDDRVERSNLNRQITYTSDAIGELKVHAAARWVASLDATLRVDVANVRISRGEQLPGLVEGADVIVLAAEWPPFEIARWTNDAALALGVPFAVSGQALPLLKIGPIYAPGRTACFACHETMLRRDSAHYDEYVAHVRSTPPRSSTFGPSSGLIGSALAMQIVELLLGGQPAALGAAVVIDTRTMALRCDVILRDEACAACQHV